MHANLCMHILASTCQDGGNPFPVIRLPVVNSVTDSSRHTLLLPALHSQWSRQVYIIHQSITGFLVVQEPTCTHAHEYRLLGASCFKFVLEAISTSCADGGEGGGGNTYHWPPYLRGNTCVRGNTSRGNTYHCDTGGINQ